MWNNQTVAVILPTFREKRSIKNVINEFDATGFVDEIIVIDNNAEKGTAEEVKKTRAKLIKEPRQGYGAAIKTGIKSTSADLLVIVEPDNTFEARDLVKLLSYSEDFDTVFGSRTHVPLIHKKSGMTFLRRVADVLMGKLISLLFLCPPLTDVGCTYRLTNRKGWQKVSREIKSDSALFATEWLLIAAKNKVKFIEIPINFKTRVGNSSLTHSFYDQIKWGSIIFLYILKTWLFNLLGKTFRHIKSPLLMKAMSK